jgi:hypothetical protein
LHRNQTNKIRNKQDEDEEEEMNLEDPEAVGANTSGQSYHNPPSNLSYSVDAGRVGYLWTSYLSSDLTFNQSVHKGAEADRLLFKSAPPQTAAKWI